MNKDPIATFSRESWEIMNIEEKYKNITQHCVYLKEL